MAKKLNREGMVKRDGCRSGKDVVKKEGGKEGRAWQ